jgi:hypothetical protein
MHMRRVLTTTLAAGLLSAAPAAAQQTLITLGGDYTVSFTGDDLDGLDNAIGLSGGMLFPMGPISYLGFEGGWSKVSFENSDANGSIFDIAGLARVGLGYADKYRPYVDARAGFGRLAFDHGVIDSSVSGPMAGGSAGVMMRAGGLWIDLHARYQHYWFGDAEVEDFVFDTDVSGGRIMLGAAINLPIGG